jgi:hypothetical protein
MGDRPNRDILMVSEIGGDPRDERLVNDGR